MITQVDVMSEEHEAHLQRIKDAIVKDIDAKYRKGQREHGGNLWNKPGMLENALEEVLDLATYLYTLKEQELRRASDRSGAGDVSDVRQGLVHGGPAR